jgi:hypothetical protein
VNGRQLDGTPEGFVWWNEYHLMTDALGAGSSHISSSLAVLQAVFWLVGLVCSTVKTPKVYVPDG